MAQHPRCIFWNANRIFFTLLESTFPLCIPQGTRRTSIYGILICLAYCIKRAGQHLGYLDWPSFAWRHTYALSRLTANPSMDPASVTAIALLAAHHSIPYLLQPLLQRLAYTHSTAVCATAGKISLVSSTKSLRIDSRVSAYRSCNLLNNEDLQSYISSFGHES